MNRILWFSVNVFVVRALNLGSLYRDVDYVDTSNCTWSGWTTCSLKQGTYTGCETTRTLELAQDQKSKEKSVIPCYHQTGSVESKPCTDGNCPNWRIGNWSDCNNTCNSTKSQEVWSALQVRSVQCGDVSGWFYDEKVCTSIRGQKPMIDQPCPCSHEAPNSAPYPLNWNTVGV